MSKVVDTSALIAVALREPGVARVEASLVPGDILFVAAPTLVELRMVLASRFGRDARHDVLQLQRRIGFSVLPFTEVHADAAFDAWTRYGKGRHPAALNFGDCMVYAVAKVARAELIYVGDDFAQTDLA